MAQYFLLFECSQAPFEAITVRCAITGDSNFIGTSKAYIDLNAAITALTSAGISERKSDTAATVLRSGYGGTFLAVSEEECTSLDLLKTRG